MKKFITFLKFCASSIGSFLLDIGIFTIASVLLENRIPEHAFVSHIVIATIIARVCSGAFNFSINRIIFGGKAKKDAGLKYLTIWLIQMLFSANIVDFFVAFLPSIHETLVKMAVDSCLFVISFFIQKLWVFAGNKKEENPITVDDEAKQKESSSKSKAK